MYEVLYGLIIAMCVSIIVVCIAITASIIHDWRIPNIPESPDETVSLD